MEGGVRTVGPPGQRATDTGPQPPPPTQQTAYQQRISSSAAASGASPVHRPVDTPQPYSKGLSSTPSSRSAASPLSPPRTGPGAPPTAYPPFAGREAPPARYLQQTTHYGSSAQVPYRENPYARMPQQQQQQQQQQLPPNEYRVSAVVSSSGGAGGLVNSNGGSISTATIIDTNSKGVGGGGGAGGNGSSKYNSSSISNNINLPPPGSTVVGMAGQQPPPQQQHQQHHSSSNLPTSSTAVVIEAGSGMPSGPGPMRQRISLLPQPQQPMDYEYSRHPGMLQQHQSQQAHPPPPQLHPSGGGHPQALLTIHSTDLGGPPMSKKIRLTNMENHHHPLPPSGQQESQPHSGLNTRLMDFAPLLKVDTREQQSSGAYHPQVEAISPTLPPDPQDELRAMKDELLQKIAKVDIDIQKVEKQIRNLRNEEASLKEASAKPPEAEEAAEIPSKNRSLAQIIYADNRRKASLAHGVLLPLGPPVELPLYNQPSDTDTCREIIEKHEQFKLRLVRHFQYLKASRLQRNAAFADLYAFKSQEWQRRVDKAESTAKRKAKEAKNREFFEKVFPELRKQREDKERFNRVGSRVKSEADLEEIMDGLQEQALEDKKMRSYAVIPPLMLDSEQKRYPFTNENGLLLDIVADAKDREHMNVWTAGEKEIFKEKYLQHPKNFCAIALNLDRKSVSDCVKFYYLSKKTENYKQLLRKARQRTRSSRNPQKSAPAQAPCIVDAMTTGVTTRLQREQQQKTGGRDRAANSASNNNASTMSSTAVASSGGGGGSAVAATSSAASCNDSASTSTTSAPSSNSNSSINIQVSTNNNIHLSNTATSTVMNNNNNNSSCTTNSGSNSSSSLNATSSYSRTAAATPPANASPLSSTIAASTSNTNSSSSTITTRPSSPALASSPPVTQCATTSTSDPVIIMDVMTSAGSVAVSAENTPPQIINNANNNSNSGDKSLQPNATNSSVEHKPSLNHCDIGIVDRDTSNAPDVGVKSSPMEVDDEKSVLAGNSVARNWTKAADDQSIKMSQNASKTCAKKDDSCERVCAVCKTKTGPMIYLEKGRGHMYGILENAFFPDTYACHDCELQMRTWRPSSSLADRNYPMCPLPTCGNMSPRKRFRSIPSRIFDLPPEIRDPVLLDFRVPEGTRECCEMCVMKMRKRTKRHFKTTTLTESELFSMQTVLDKWGPDWARMEKMIGKPAKALRIYFIDNKKTKKLGSIVQKYFAANPQVVPTSLTDGENTDWSSSDEEPEGASDTASAESPNNPVGNAVSVSMAPKGEMMGMHSTVNILKSSVDPSERLMPPHHHHQHHHHIYMPKKHKISEECDSSATETADEENESSPANRHSPKGHLQFGNQTTITMVPSSMGGSSMQQQSMVNGPMRDTPRNVQDVISNVIERGLKAPSVVPPMLKGPGHHPLGIGIKSMMMGERPNEMAMNRINDSIKSRVLNHHENSLATLSVVNPHQQQQQQQQPPPHGGMPGSHLIQEAAPLSSQSHPHGLQNQIAATITPVPLSVGGVNPVTGQMSHSSSLQIIPSLMDHKGGGGGGGPNAGDHTITVRLPLGPPPATGPENEPQTLDLSIKKRDSNVFPPPKSIHNSTTIYRNENVMQPMYVPPPHAAQENYPGYRMSKSPINIPIQSRRPQGGPPPPQPQNPPPTPQQQHHQFMMQQHHQHQQQQQKMNPKLSPKQMPGNNSALSGAGAGAKSVGSITHGTPMNSLGGPQSGMLIQGGSTLSPRVDGMTRQTPPETGGGGHNKIGSITQGTPLHMVPMHLQGGHGDGKGPPPQQQHPPTVRSPYEGAPPNSSRQSPAYQQGPPGSVYARSPGMPPYNSGHEAQQWSSRQILTNDYLTSQQMHRGGNAPPMPSGSGRSDKESASPRNPMLTPGLVGQGGPYYDKDQRSASRESMMSRSSPAAERMLHGSPSPMRTPPPPQRQGVIQRHNTSKSPSPASNRIHVMSHYAQPGLDFTGHEALSSFVEVAVQQPSLPVPHKEDKGRNATPTEQNMAMQMRQQMEMQRRPGGIPPPQQMYLREQQMQLDHLRELEHKQREQREREHMVAAEREREQREHDRVRDMLERERSMDRGMPQMRAERERQARDLMDRERSMMAERYANSGPPLFGRDRPPMGPVRGDGESLTAAILIDAIITHQITQSNVDSSIPSRDLNRPNFFLRGDHAPPSGPPQPHSLAPGGGAPHPGGHGAAAMENNGKSQSPHVIKIDLDSDSSQPPIIRPSASSAASSSSSTSVKNITIGQITDSVIAKDFATSSLLSHRPPYGSLYHHQHHHHEGQPPPPVSMGAPPDQQWIRRVPVSQQQSMPPQQHSSKDAKEGAGRVPTPDDRQIIRMAQTPSPRSKPMHEPVSPPDDNSVPAGPPQVPLSSHYYSSGGQTSISLQPLHGGGQPPPLDRRPNSGPPPAPSSHNNNNSSGGPTPTSSHQTNFVLDCYVKNRIVEEMRIQEKGSADRQGGQVVGPGGSGNPHDNRSATPGDEEMMRPNSRASAPTTLGPPYNTSSSAPSGTTVAYPYSAWNVSGAPPSNHGPPPRSPVNTNKAVDHGLNNSNNSNTVVVGGSGGGATTGGGPAEPKPLLSSQYEELSDEEEGNGN